MAGTKAGGRKAALTNKIRHGKDFYANIGRRGGQNGHTGGFAANPELAKIAGKKGGAKSKRGPAKPKAPHIDDDEYGMLSSTDRSRILKEIDGMED